MKRKHKNIMLLGTGSNVGKSIINAGFCRIFYQDGYSVVPFKSQNMALNSFITRMEKRWEELRWCRLKPLISSHRHL